MRYLVSFPGHPEQELELVPRDGAFEVHIDGHVIAAHVRSRQDGAVRVEVGGKGLDVYLHADRDAYRVTCEGVRMNGVRIESDRARMAAAASRPSSLGAGNVVAPMPGRVVKILVDEGEMVDEGSPVAVVEAMKMENELRAEVSGQVLAVHAIAGQNVEGGTVLVEIGPPP